MIYLALHPRCRIQTNLHVPFMPSIPIRQFRITILITGIGNRFQSGLFLLFASLLRPRYLLLSVTRVSYRISGLLNSCVHFTYFFQH